MMTEKLFQVLAKPADLLALVEQDDPAPSAAG
jgi:hypothetical protein